MPIFGSLPVEAPADSSLPSLHGEGFVDRRRPRTAADGPGVERRQFGNSHSDLSSAGRELAVAIDQYKVTHRRRYITPDEILSIIRELGYRQLG